MKNKIILSFLLFILSISIFAIDEYIIPWDSIKNPSMDINEVGKRGTFIDNSGETNVVNPQIPQFWTLSSTRRTEVLNALRYNPFTTPYKGNAFEVWSGYNTAGQFYQDITLPSGNYRLCAILRSSKQTDAFADRNKNLWVENNSNTFISPYWPVNTGNEWTMKYDTLTFSVTNDIPDNVRLGVLFDVFFQIDEVFLQRIFTQKEYLNYLIEESEKIQTNEMHMLSKVLVAAKSVDLSNSDAVDKVIKDLYIEYNHTRIYLTSDNINEIDVTQLYISNPGFESSNDIWDQDIPGYWKNEKGFDTDIKDNNHNTYKTINAEGLRVFNLWNNNSGKPLTQKIINVMPGKYRLEVSYASNIENVGKILLDGREFPFNPISDKNFTRISTDIIDIVNQETHIGFDSDRWYKVDEFKLYYCGKLNYDISDEIVINNYDISYVDLSLTQNSPYYINLEGTTSSMIRYYDNNNPNLVVVDCPEGIYFGDKFIKTIRSNNQLICSEDINLEEGFNFDSKENIICSGNVTFTKDFSKMTSGMGGDVLGWKTIVFPFKPTNIKGQNKLGNWVKLKPFENQSIVAGSCPFWLKKISEDLSQDYVDVTFDEIEANVPYIICMPNNSSYPSSYCITGKVEFSAFNEEGTTIFNIQTPDVFMGTDYNMSFSYKNISKSPLCYTLDDFGSGFISDYADVKPFESYVLAKNISNAPARFAIFNRTPTSIEELLLQNKNNSINITTNGNKVIFMSDIDKTISIYNINGSVIKTIYVTADNIIETELEKGVYIIEKNKIIITQ